VLVKERAEQVRAALDKLSPNQRSVFLMRFAEEMDLAEIAAVTRMPINTVKTHLHRALKSVRAQVAVRAALRGASQTSELQEPTQGAAGTKTAATMPGAMQVAAGTARSGR
jgi:DNA-binding CsgD family transcriptional regulator